MTFGKYLVPRPLIFLVAIVASTGLGWGAIGGASSTALACAESRTSSGLSVIVIPAQSKAFTSICLIVKTGSADEGPSERGISFLLERMAFGATEQRTAEEVATEIDALGGAVKAYTSWDETVYSITAPSSASLKALDILTESILRPLQDEEGIRAAKQSVLEQILSREDSSQTKVSDSLFKTAYLNSGYRYPIVGQKDTVEKITLDDLVTYRKKWYVPENMFLVVVGDVDAKKVVAEVERLTADLKPTGFIRPSRQVEPTQKEIRTALIKDPHAEETLLNLAFQIPSIRNPDVNALDLAAEILGSGAGSRLMAGLKKKGLVKAISAQSITARDSGLIVISAILENPGLIEETTKAIMEELKLLGNEPPSESELQEAKVNVELQRVNTRQTVQGVARSMGSWFSDIGDPEYEPKYLKLNLAVTPRDISTVVKRYLVPPNVSLAVLAPEADSKDFQIDKLAGIMRSFSPTFQTGGQDSNVFFKTLPNGIRVFVAPDHTNPVVSFRVSMLGGKRFENKDNQGIMDLVGTMLTKGAGQMNEAEITAKARSLGGRIRSFSELDSFSLAGTFFSRDAGQALQLMAQIYTDPTLSQDMLEKERQSTIDRIATESENPLSSALHLTETMLFPGHPYGFIKVGTVQTVSRLTSKNLKDAYKRIAVPSNTVVACVGDIDPQFFFEEVERLFGKLPVTDFKPPKSCVDEPLGKTSEKTFTLSGDSAVLLIGFRSPAVSDNDRYAFEALNRILMDLEQRFAEQNQRADSVFSFKSIVQPRIDSGILVLSVICDPSKMESNLDRLFKEIEVFRKEPLTNAEVQKATNNLIASRQFALQTTEARAGNLAYNVLCGLGYDLDSKYVAKMSQVSTEDVLRVARKYLDPQQCSIVKGLPDTGGRRSQ